MRNFDFYDGDELPEQDEAEFFYEIDPIAGFGGSPFPVELLGANYNTQLLSTAISICEKNWLWKFKSLPKKLELIMKAYIVLQQLMESEQEKE